MVTTSGTGCGQNLIRGSDHPVFGRKLENSDGVVEPLVGFVIIGPATGHTRTGVGAEHPIIHVDLVGTKVGHRSTCITLKPPPIAELVHVGVAIFAKFSLNDSLVGGIAIVIAHRAVPLPGNVGDPAQQAVAIEDPITRVLITRITATLVAELEQFFGFPGRDHHRASAFDCVGHQLLAINVFSRPQSSIGMLRVHEVRSRNDDRINV